MSDVCEQLRARLSRVRPDLDSQRMRIDDLLGQATTHLRHALEVQMERLDGLEHRLSSLSPADTLRRGYAIVQRQPDMAVLSDATGVGGRGQRRGHAHPRWVQCRCDHHQARRR